jgi:4-hydroxy-tetrahydrodipicolinate reductase
VGFSSPRRHGEVLDVDGVSVELLGTEAAMEQALRDHSDAIVVDYSTPSAVAANVRRYAEAKVPFVVGTTGGNPEEIEEATAQLHAPCVIAPNMHKQIVALQALLQDAAETYPSAFSGYSLAVTESHQAAKKDTSGTAKALIQVFGKLGTPIDVADVEKLRTPDAQLKFGVPEAALGGHAFHTYELTGPDTTFQIQHNVCGRVPYAEGTVDAVEFLVQLGPWKKTPGRFVFSMVDILKGVGTQNSPEME